MTNSIRSETSSLVDDGPFLDNLFRRWNWLSHVERHCSVQRHGIGTLHIVSPSTFILHISLFLTCVCATAVPYLAYDQSVYRVDFNCLSFRSHCLTRTPSNGNTVSPCLVATRLATSAGVDTCICLLLRGIFFLCVCWVLLF